MAEQYFPWVESWELSTLALEASREEMARDGREGNEGIALWLGNRRDGRVKVRTVVQLRGAGVLRLPDQLSISADLINEVTSVAIERRQAVVGQIHSHGGDWTDLSPIDKSGGFRVSGFVSVVAPHFAKAPALDLLECGVHVFNEVWRRLSFAEIANRFRISPDGDVEVVVVGA